VGLRETAEADLAFIIEDADAFGWAITVTDPSDASADLVGASGDISELIDPETGQLVSGRRAHVSLRLSSLVAAGLGIPEAVSDKASKPWRVTFDDIGGTSHTFKIAEARPDRTIGLVVCLLESYQ